MSVTLDTEKQLYVINDEHAGVACWGFDSIFNQAKALAEKLNLPDLMVKKKEFGQLSAYEKYQKLIAAIGENNLGTWFNPETPIKVRKILESARKSEITLRLFLGESKTGKDWLEDCDVIGTIGRSIGPLKVPLLISQDESGGPGILDSAIVRIIRVDNKTELYRHPNYHLGGIIIGRDGVGDYPVVALVDGKIHARFKSEGKAYHWAAYMMGEVMENISSM